MPQFVRELAKDSTPTKWMHSATHKQMPESSAVGNEPSRATENHLDACLIPLGLVGSCGPVTCMVGASVVLQYVLCCVVLGLYGEGWTTLTANGAEKIQRDCVREYLELTSED